MLTTAKWGLALCLVAAIFSPTVRAQTVINATSCQESAVSAALNQASGGSVVVAIPSGTCAWTSQLAYTVPSGVSNLTIQGQTSVNCTGTAGTSSYACTAADSTVIEDGVSSNSSILQISTGSASLLVRVTGITLEGPASSNYNKYSGDLDFRGSSTGVRVDHSHFETNPSDDSAELVEFDGVQGVVDHSLFNIGNNGTVGNGVRVFAYSSGYGDSSWNNAPTAWGSSQGVYIENNVFNGSAPNDCDDSGQVVMRYNTINDAYLGAQNHSTSSGSAGWRGCRRMEVYKNYFTGPSAAADAAVSVKGGTALIWGNNVASGYYRFIVAQTDRNTTNYSETIVPNGWGYCGTAILGIGSNWDGNTLNGYPCLDGVGRGQTQQPLNGLYFPSRADSSTGTQSWPQQDLEPVYAWMNSLFSGATELNIRDTTTAKNRDIYVDAASFNGTSGTGNGPVASRPSTCTAGPGGTYGQSPTGSYGVAYWATDANAGNGELYVCTSTNTWTAVYSPYTYPHPLESGAVSSSSNAPAPPTGLSATVQ